MSHCFCKIGRFPEESRNLQKLSYATAVFLIKKALLDNRTSVPIIMSMSYAVGVQSVKDCSFAVQDMAAKFRLMKQCFILHFALGLPGNCVIPRIMFT